MTLSLPVIDVKQLQTTFLQADHVTPPLVHHTLQTLLSREQTSSLDLWVSIAVLHTLTDSDLTRKITSIEATSALLRVGLEASKRLTAKTGHTPSANLDHPAQVYSAIRSQLELIKGTFQAWEKTGIVAKSPDALEFDRHDAGTGDEHENEEDEELAWFDSKATPSPPPGTAPSIVLPSLIFALSQPQLLASLIAPHPDRLVIWLKKLPPTIFSGHVWPRRRDIIRSAFVYHAIAGDGGTEVVNTLHQARLLPWPTASGAESSLWSDLAAADESSKGREALAGPEANGSYAADLASWYLSLVHHLGDELQATTFAAALTGIVLTSFEDASHGAEPEVRSTLSQLTQIQEEAEIVECLASTTDAFKARELVAEPARQLIPLLKEGRLDAASLSRILRFIASRTERAASDVAVQVFFEAYELDEASSPILALLLAQLDGGQEQQVRQMLMSLILSSKDGRKCTLLQSLLVKSEGTVVNTKASQDTTIAQIFPAFERDDRLVLPNELILPTARGVYRSLQEIDASDTTASEVYSRCRLYVESVSQSGQFADRLKELPPYVLVFATGREKVQVALVQKTVASAAKAGLDDATGWLNFSNDLLAEGARGRIFDALPPDLIVGEVLKGALLSNHSAAAYSLLVRHLPSLPADKLDKVLIESARDRFDRIQSGRAGVPDLRTVRDILSRSPNSASSSSSVASSQAFLKAVLRLMQLNHPLPSFLHSSLPMPPVEIRLAADKVDVIRHWLGLRNDVAWKREDDVLDTAWGLVQGSARGMLGSEKQPSDALDGDVEGEDGDETLPSKSMVKVRVLALLAEAAISNSDLTLTTQYADSMLQIFREMLKRSHRISADTNVNAPASSSQQQVQEEVNRAREVTWTTLFLLSKHPSCTDINATRRWLVEALAYAPEDRMEELLKRWRALPAQVPVVSESTPRYQPASSSSAARAESSPSRAASATSSAQGLGAGVFSLAAAAVNRSPWPLRLGGATPVHPNDGDEDRSSLRSGDESLPPSSSRDVERSSSPALVAGTLSLVGSSTAGVTNALSSLAGQLHLTSDGGYSSRLTGLLGGGDRAGAGGGPGAVGRSARASGSRPITPQAPSSVRSLGVTDDAKGGGGGGAAAATTTAPRRSNDSARSAAHLFDETIAGGGGGGGGWAALGTRGMGWLMGDEGERSGR